MTRNVIVVGHSDADGHAIAEQARRNLSLVPSFDVEVLVDPKRTPGHQCWLHLDLLPELEEADFVFFVDLMFSPASFVSESESLIKFAKDRPKTQFFVIDHHPLPEHRFMEADNIRSAYRPDVFECVVGPKSGMMVLAAICEHQKELVSDICEPHHEILARGLRRAAAPGGGLAGEALMSLLRADRWDALYALGTEEASSHRLVRGKRLAKEPRSEALVLAERAANSAEKAFLNGKNEQYPTTDSRSEPMPYDVTAERFVLERDDPPSHRNSPVPTKDLEILVTLLEMAALSLTNRPGATFTREQLIHEVREIAGEGIEIDERDVKNILSKARFLEARSGKLRVR